MSCVLLAVLCVVQLSLAQDEAAAAPTTILLGADCADCVVGGAPCFTDEECFGKAPNVNGVCNADLSPPACECYDIGVGANCERTRKSQQTALVLSIVLGPYGADRFYLGHTSMAIGKLILSLALCMLPCVPICCILCGKKGDDSRNIFRGGMLAPCVVFCIAVVGVMVWWFIDIALIAQNKMPDGAGYSLLPSS